VNAEVLTIGTELLLGQILDTNALYLGKKLAEVGVNLYYKTTVGDNIGRVKEALGIACNRADLIIITGGLGPTVDDITRQAVAEFTGKQLVPDNASLKHIQDRFRVRNVVMTDNNKLQAYFPAGAVIIENKNGTAPGFIAEYGTTIIMAMPGVPSEMYPMMEQSLIPYIINRMGGSHQVIRSKSLKVIGMGESLVDDRIQDLFRDSRNPTIGVYAHTNEIEIRLTAKADSCDDAAQLIEALKRQIYERLGNNIFGEDEETLESKIAEKAIEKKVTIATAESCTAGLLAFRLTSVPGSSRYFIGGVNSYANEAKINVLGVPAETIKSFGAVSPECASEMAKAVRKKFNADIGISITGIAGPDGGTADKPVGLVYIGVDISGKVRTYRNNFLGSRESVRTRSAQTALLQLYTGLTQAAGNGK
jgi:nicotinamide-nucleotide amidase